MLLGAVAICAAQNVDFQGAGTLGACILGIVARYGWRRQGINFKVACDLYFTYDYINILSTVV